MKICNVVRVMSVLVTFNICGSLPVIPLETERLYLRPVELADAPALAEVALNPDVLKLTGLFPPLTTLEDVQGFVKSFLVGDAAQNISPRYPKSWSIVEKQSGTVIGLVVFVAYLERHQRAEIAYAIAPAYWNHGYATEACQVVARHAFSCGLLRLYGMVDPENKTSERVLQKLNMQCEGLMRSYMIVRGQRVDRKMYAVVASY